MQATLINNILKTKNHAPLPSPSPFLFQELGYIESNFFATTKKNVVAQKKILEQKLLPPSLFTTGFFSACDRSPHSHTLMHTHTQHTTLHASLTPRRMYPQPECIQNALAHVSRRKPWHLCMLGILFR